MNVVIDGTEYVPRSSAATPSVGVAITTRNRNEQIEYAVQEHLRFLPPSSVFVVDDGSDEPVVLDDVEVFRFEESRGIPAAKNKCLEILMDRGFQHLFLFDDDAQPMVNYWWEPYVDSPEPHLSYQFLDLAGARKLNDVIVLQDDGHHVAYSGQRGVMLYYDRRAIEAVGGFDPIYGRGMYEHSDLANRIHHAGLTTWRYADVAGSAELIHSMDEHEEIERSVPSHERAALVDQNVRVHNGRRNTGYRAFVPYREQRDVVITTLLTSEPDPQRGAKWPADADLLKDWATSITGATPVVLADELTDVPGDSVLVPVPPVSMNPYFRRWLHIYQYLRDHPEIRNVFCTDGTDVVMQVEPWSHLEPGKIYVGSELKLVGCPWMVENHPAQRIQDFIRANADRQLLNAGILGGSREDVMSFAHWMVREHNDVTCDRFWGRDAPGVEVGDMATFNQVAYTHFADRLVTGPRVHTVFKAHETNDFSWVRHK